jgi:hypothetical protein
MANLAKEGTTIRHIMDSLFRYFDNGSLWSADHGLAFYVLKDMLFSLDDSGIIFFILDSIKYFVKYLFSSKFSSFHVLTFWLLQGKTHMFYYQY